MTERLDDFEKNLWEAMHTPGWWKWHSRPIHKEAYSRIAAKLGKKDTLPVRDEDIELQVDGTCSDEPQNLGS